MHLTEYSERKIALGGDVVLTFVGEYSSDQAARLFREMWQRIAQFEKRFSRFLPSSELTRLNMRAGTPVAVSQEMTRLLRAALDQVAHTDGLYNPFVLPALQREGYKTSAHPSSQNEPISDYSNRRVVAPSELQLNAEQVLLPLATALDLGGCGKGYLADETGEYLREQGAVGYWLEFSGDIAVFGNDVSGNPICIGVQDASQPERSLPQVLIRCPVTTSGVATSGTFMRPGQAGQLRRHHIIDPRTNTAAETDVLLATVCAPRAIDADVLASCAVIVGSTEADAFLRSKGATSWIIQYRNAAREIKTLIHGDGVVQRTEYAYA